jgi:type I restriction enzyme R subunit
MGERNEARTRKDLIDPKLKDAGWDFDNQWQVEPEYTITAGRIHFDGKTSNRGSPSRADYLLRYRPSKAIAIVEAKKESEHHCEGAEQAKTYARKLGLWFAYSTNGIQIEFFDLKADTQETVETFHTPEELWQRYLSYTQINPSKENLDALTWDYYDESQIGQRRRPRYYQELAVNNAIEAVLKGEKRVLITQATGTGKTFTSLQLVYKLWKSKAAKKILFIVDRNLLADQAFNDFNNAMDKDACYRLSPSDARFPLSRDLYFGIYQTLVGQDDEGNSSGSPDRYKEFPSDFFDLIVIDEAHRGGANQAGSWFRLLDYFNSAIQVGLTATPKREESNDTYKYFGNPVVSYSLKNGIEDGYLSPYIIKRVTSNIDALGYRPDHQGIKDVTGQEIEVKDYFTPEFQRELIIPERTRAFAYHLLRHLFSTDPLGKTIVFCVDQKHALDMAKYVNEAFTKYKEKYGFDYSGSYATRITGNDKDANGKYPFLEKFQDLESNEPIVVTTSKLLTTGIDVKTVKNVVIFRNIGSMVEFKQIIGRGTRTYEPNDPSRAKLGFYILEYANFSTQLFNDPEWDDAPSAEEDEGEILIHDVPEGTDSEGTEDAPVPVADKEEDVDSKGIYDEHDEERKRQLRYRMSEEFLRGAVQIAAESISFTGEDGKPISADQFVIYQSSLFLQSVKDLKSLQEIWLDSAARKKFMEEGISDGKFNIQALTQIFFDKNKLNKTQKVDAYDVIANMVFGQKFLTKEERIRKARTLNKEFFEAKPEQVRHLLDDMLSVYREMETQPFVTTPEFFQTAQLQKYGTVTEIQTLVGGSDALKGLVTGLQKALYDVRIAA